MEFVIPLGVNMHVWLKNFTVFDHGVLPQAPLGV